MEKHSSCRAGDRGGLGSRVDCGHGAPAAAAAQSRSTPASNFSTLFAAADAAREAGRLDEATGLYRKALALRPDWRDGWWDLGTILYERDAYPDAARAFGRLVALDPKNGTAYLMLALCEYQVDRDASAMEHIRAAKQLCAECRRPAASAGVSRGHAPAARGTLRRALDVLQPLVAAAVDDESLDFALGLGVLLTRPQEAPAQGSAAREIVVRVGRAERYFLSKAFDVAKTEYSALVQEAPMVPNLRYAYRPLPPRYPEPRRSRLRFSVFTASAALAGEKLRRPDGAIGQSRKMAAGKRCFGATDHLTAGPNLVISGGERASRDCSRAPTHAGPRPATRLTQ